jgi:hypothetical protein
MVDRNSTVAGHDAEQLGLLGPLPATETGANRRGHRNRLTRRNGLNSSDRVCRPKTTPGCCCGATHSRLPSQDETRLTGWEVQPPLGLEVPANPLSSTFHQGIPYARERPHGLPIDVF